MANAKNDIVKQVLSKYGIHAESAAVQVFGTGLINHTWKIRSEEKNYILQRINEQVFTNPNAIASNIQSVNIYLQQNSPEYFFVTPVVTLSGALMVHVTEAGGGYYRLFPFVNGSHSKDVVQNAGQAFEAAVQFGRFTRLLSGFDAEKIHITLPSFHDLGLRYVQFEDALKTGSQERVIESKDLISSIQNQKGIVDEFTFIQMNPSFKKRVTHHDTKISNVLFDSSDKSICVIDLDTLMPGYFISDVGDMMRTYLPTVSEEEKDFSKIEVRNDVYKAIVTGYYSEMGDELSDVEKGYFFYAAKFMIYMQALRFLTDHINNDVYYGAKYPGHNFVRAGNQLTLLERVIEKESSLTSM
jgi:Ser/Thr protein kinase RdoA (MazF antagonist)